MASPRPVTPANFEVYTLPRITHFYELAVPTLHANEWPDLCDLKVYQDILVYNFLLQNCPKGARLLEIGGADSRIIQSLKHEFEFWNLDKLEGLGHGPRSLASDQGFTLVKDYIGAFNTALPEAGFDCVFSISTLEHVPEDPQTAQNIYLDIQRLLKPGGFSLHCMDIVLRGDSLWANPILDALYAQAPIVNPRIPDRQILQDASLWTLPAFAYYTRWMSQTRQTPARFGRPTSYNFLWIKA